jgi:hypothetical protein
VATSRLSAQLNVAALRPGISLIFAYQSYSFWQPYLLHGGAIGPAAGKFADRSFSDVEIVGFSLVTGFVLWRKRMGGGFLPR